MEARDAPALSGGEPERKRAKASGARDGKVIPPLLSCSCFSPGDLHGASTGVGARLWFVLGVSLVP